MKKLVLKRAGAVLLVFLLCLVVAGSVASKTNKGSSSKPKYTSLDEHPWDILKNAVRIEVVAMGSDYVILKVWFSWSEPFVIIKIDWSYFESGDRASGKQGFKTKPGVSLGD